jgi:C4-dicarboxylate transporter DctM subunit
MGDKATLEEIYAGIWPFVLCDMVVLVILIAFPEIVLWLPNKIV